MKLSFLVDNKTECLCCKAEWGLSMLIESGRHKILFDTGASSMFVENAKGMGIDLSQVQAVCISHGHFDHTQGLEAFLDCNQNAPIYLHKEALHRSYGVGRDGLVEEENCGIWWNTDLVERMKPRLIRTEQVVTVNENMTLIGNIPTGSDFIPTEDFVREVKEITQLEQDRSPVLEKDTMEHEQFLVVEESEKIFIISGCCHKGVLPTILRAKQLYPDKSIGAFIGGMHLYLSTIEELETLGKEMMKLGVEKVVPVHCSGIQSLVTFKNLFGDRCIAAAAGEVYEF